MEKHMKRIDHFFNAVALLSAALMFLSLGNGLLFSQTLSDIAKDPGLKQTFPMPGYFRNNIFTRNSVPQLPAESSSLIERLTHNGTVVLSERDCIELALKNSLDIEVERDNTPAARYDVLKTHGLFDPIFKASANTDRATKPSSNFLQTGIFGAVTPIDSLTQNFNFSYLQLFETGTSAEVDYFNTKSFYRSRLATLDPSITSQLRFSFLQPLLKNRGIGANTYPIKVARNNLNITRENFNLQLINILNQVLNTYWELVFDRADVRVKQASLDLAIKTNEDNKRQVEIGTLAPIDVVQSETAVAQRRQDLIVSQYTLQQTEDTLKRFLSGARDPGAVIAHLEPVDQAKMPADQAIPKVPDAINIALKNRPELRQADLALNNSQLKLKYTKNQLLPEVDLTGLYAWSGLAGNSQVLNINGTPVLNPDGSPVIIQAGYPETTRQLFSFQFPEYSFGVTLTIPFKNRNAEADFGRASYELRQAQSRLALSEQQIALAVRNAVTVMQMSQATVEASTRTRELEEKTLDAENKKYQLGASTIRFVLQEQTNLAIDQTNEVRAIVNYIKSKIALETAQGTLLPSYNVQVDNALSGSVQSPKPPAGASNVNLVAGSDK